MESIPELLKSLQIRALVGLRNTVQQWVNTVRSRRTSAEEKVSRREMIFTIQTCPGWCSKLGFMKFLFRLEVFAEFLTVGFGGFFFYALYSTLLHLPPLRLLIENMLPLPSYLCINYLFNTSKSHLLYIQVSSMTDSTYTYSTYIYILHFKS
jgi:hypothetical protein